MMACQNQLDEVLAFYLVTVSTNRLTSSFVVLAAPCDHRTALRMQSNLDTRDFAVLDTPNSRN